MMIETSVAINQNIVHASTGVVVPNGVSIGGQIDQNAINIGGAIDSNTIDVSGDTAPTSTPGIDDTPYEEFNLDGKIFGNMGISQPFQMIDASVARAYVKRIGRTCYFSAIISIPYFADWGEPDPYFPLSIVGIQASDMPFEPIAHPIVESIGHGAPTIGDFSLINTSEHGDDGDTPLKGMAIGTVATDFGGSLPTPIVTMFHASETTTGNVENLVFEGNNIEMVGKNVVLYWKFTYECKYAIGGEP